MMKPILSFLRQYVAYYACAVLGGFAALWIQSQGLFSPITIGYLAGVIFMPAIVKTLKGGESIAETWQNINEMIDKFQDSSLNPTIDIAQVKGTELADWIDELVSEKVAQVEKKLTDLSPPPATKEEK